MYRCIEKIVLYLHIRHSLHFSVHSLNPLLHNLLLLLHLLYILPNHRVDIRVDNIVSLFKMVMIEEAEDGKDLQNMNRAENFRMADIEINA